MKNRRNPLFTIIITAIYTVTILAYIFSLIIEYNRGATKAEQRFSTLTRQTNLILRENDAGSPAFADAFLEILGNVSDIAGVQVALDGRLIFSYPVNLAENSPTNSNFVIAKSTFLYTRDGLPVMLTAAIYTLKPSSIFYNGRIAFFVLLITTVVCIVYLVLLYTKNNSATEEENLEDDFADSDSIDDEIADFSEDSEANLEKSEEEKSKEDDKVNEVPFISEASIVSPEESAALLAGMDENISEEKIEEKKNDDIPSVPSAESEEKIEETLENSEKTLIEEPLPDLSDFEEPLQETESAEIEPKADKTEEKVIEEIKTDAEGHIQTAVEDLKKKHEEAENPAPKISELTGFYKEEELLPKLDSELVTAASSEQDLSLLTVQIANFDWKSEVAQKLCQKVKEVAKSEEYVFEYKNDGCTIILQNTDIDQALSIAENLHLDIVSLLSQNTLYNTIGIGISSRSSRLISGTRIAHESEQALFRALADKESPIIAFKVNPEKYRNYLASEASKQNA